MIRTKLSLVMVVALAALSMVAGAAPLPMSAVGVDRTIDIAGQDLAVLGGGRFSGTVTTPAMLSYSTSFWCVDIENYASYEPYRANVTLLEAWTNGMNSQVQKGTTTNTGFVVESPALTPLQRYQAAAYLLSGMQAFQTGTVGSLDDERQNAIWRLLDIDPSGTPSNDATVNNFVATAAQYIIDNPTYGFGQFAVVSGKAYASGALNGTAYQTFLVQVTPGGQVPEPGTYALMGGGLIGLAALARRRKA